MNWDKGFIATYHMNLVNPVTWRDQGAVKMLSGSTSRTNEGLRQMADITVSDFERKCEKYVRVWLEAEQGGDAARVDLFTGIANAPSESIGTCRTEVDLECYSVLKPVEGIPLERGWYAPAGMPGGELIKNLLSVTPAPVLIHEGSPVLTDYIIAEDNENRLTMTDKILQAIGWRLRINGSGLIEVGPMPQRISATFGEERDMIEAPIKPSDTWFQTPNAFRAISGDSAAVAMDSSAESALSIVNRGREVWEVESDCSLNDGESLEQYALRRLREEQKRAGSLDYERGFDPDAVPSDLIRIHYPEYGLTGTFYIESQDMDFDTKASVSEEVSVWA